jgi:integrase
MPLSAIDLAGVCRFLAWAGETRSPATCNKLRSYLRALLHFAQRQHLLSFDWLDDISRMPSPRRVPRAFLLCELEAMLEACRGLAGAVMQEIPAGLFWEALLLTLYDTGLRVSACLAIQRADVDMDAGWVLVHGETQKQRADQLLGLSEQTVEALRRIWSPPRELLFPWTFSRTALRRRLLSILKRAGVAHGMAAGGRGLWQRFRRLTASELQAHGANPTAVLGHSSPLVTRAYLDPRICGTTRAVDCLPRPASPQPRLRVV